MVSVCHTLYGRHGLDVKKTDSTEVKCIFLDELAFLSKKNGIQNTNLLNLHMQIIGFDRRTF